MIAKLKTSDILTLIIEMGNNNPISKNIVKKQKRDLCFSYATTYNLVDAFLSFKVGGFKTLMQQGQ